MPPASMRRFTFTHALGSKPSTGISMRTCSGLLTSQPAFFRAGSMSSFLVVASFRFGLDNFSAPVVLSQRQLYTRGKYLSKCCYLLEILLGANLHVLEEPFQGFFPIRKPLARLGSSTVPGSTRTHELNRNLAHHLQCHIELF